MKSEGADSVFLVTHRALTRWYGLACSAFIQQALHLSERQYLYDVDLATYGMVLSASQRALAGHWMVSPMLRLGC